jgi:TolB protein
MRASAHHHLLGYLVAAVAITCLAGLVMSGSAFAAYPGKNGKIAFDRFDGGIRTMNPDGSGETPLTSPPSRFRDFQPVWAPDGRRLAYVRACFLACPAGTPTGAAIRIVGADGSDDRFVLQTAAYDPAPTWSPDGERLAFSDQGDLWTAGADGSGAERITQTPEPEGTPTWSPDGTEIAFVVEDGCCSSGIDAVRPDGTGRRTIVAPPPPPAGGVNFYQYPDWAPGGGRLVFAHERSCEATGQHLHFVNRDGTGGPAPDEGYFCYLVTTHPSWSPDGARIVSWGWDDSSGESRPIDHRSVGSSADRVNTGVFGRNPDWQPIPVNTYPRPQSARPVDVTLVPAYRACTAPGHLHGPPLAEPSCAPPLTSSSALRLGSRGHGKVFITARPGNPATPADEADVRLLADIADVRSAANGSDYTGTLEARVGLRITDKDNTPHPGGPGAGTLADTSLSYAVPCSATPDTTVGATCAVDTTAEALVAGMVKEGMRAIWELGQIRLHDAEGNVFMRQGVFVP